MITAHDLTIVADVSYRQVDYWTRTGRLIPIGPATPGSGSQRLYDDDQVALAVQLSRLTKAGIPMPQAHDVALDLLEHGHADLFVGPDVAYRLVPIAGPQLAGDPIPADVAARVTEIRPRQNGAA